MKNQSNDIREIMNDINDIINNGAINESFAFGEKTPSIQPQKVAPLSMQKQMPTEEAGPELTSTPETEMSMPDKGVDEKVKQIRKVAIETLAELDPTVDPDSYKMIKSIWDSCDKYLTKDNVAKPKEQTANNI